MKFFAVLLSLVSLTAYAETRTKIAVIDTGLIETPLITPYLCMSGHLDLTHTGLRDNHGHGTNIAHIIAKYLDPKHQCLMIIKWLDLKPEQETIKAPIQNVAKAVDHARLSEVKYVNISIAGPGSDDKEHDSIAKAIAAKITIVVAAGNERQNLDDYCNAYPACHSFHSPYFFVVANYDGANPNWATNYAGPVNATENGQEQKGGGFTMSGTSQAAAVFLGKLVKQRESNYEACTNSRSCPLYRRMRH